MRLQSNNINKVRVINLYAIYWNTYPSSHFEFCSCIPALHWAADNISMLGSILIQSENQPYSRFLHLPFFEVKVDHYHIWEETKYKNRVRNWKTKKNVNIYIIRLRIWKHNVPFCLRYSKLRFPPYCRELRYLRYIDSKNR